MKFDNCTVCYEDKELPNHSTICSACKGKKNIEKYAKRKEEEKAENEMWRKVITRRLAV